LTESQAAAGAVGLLTGSGIVVEDPPTVEVWRVFCE
jgi:hypothetical protein